MVYYTGNHPLAWASPGFTLKVRDKKEPIYIACDPWETGRPLDKSFTFFRRKLCQVIKKPFAPYKMLPAEGFEGGIILEFFGGNLKERALHCPQKCAACLKPVEQPFLDKITTTYLGLRAEIPCCLACRKERFRFLRKRPAVRSLHRTVVLRDRIWFEQWGFAREFAEINLAE
ncbi:MAG: hypothetical protein JXA42_18405 [Anaerolineales bacterium]|nr:hypothetical protein [Anaerolineales bacterium]